MVYHTRSYPVNLLPTLTGSARLHAKHDRARGDVSAVIHGAAGATARLGRFDRDRSFNVAKTSHTGGSHFGAECVPGHPEVTGLSAGETGAMEGAVVIGAGRPELQAVRLASISTTYLCDPPPVQAEPGCAPGSGLR